MAYYADLRLCHGILLGPTPGTTEVVSVAKLVDDAVEELEHALAKAKRAYAANQTKQAVLLLP